MGTRSVKFSILSTLTLFLLSSCAKKVGQNAIVKSVQSTQSTAPRPAANVIDQGSTQRVVTDVTLDKNEILNREFLYGSDLQYSAINDEDFELTLQSLAIGHVPARFKIVADKLQLIADNSISFESDINQPGRLITSFAILAENENSITVRIDQASPTLVTVLMGSEAPVARTTWVRSVNYVREGNYLMFESSIEGPDGSIAEFMESIFPRSSLVKENDQAIFADSTLNELADRFRFLSWGPIWLNHPDSGRIQTQSANRFKIEDKKPILWYVTPNIPDDYVDQVRTGIEGWNRYSQSMMGHDMVKFAGKLPEGIKIGDPRFNVINWDSVAEAGAAYESQASDPLTGIQSHSLIYLPYAWVNIGRDFWNVGEFSEAQENAASRTKKALAARSFLEKHLAVNCIDDATAHLSLEALTTPEEFSKELLKGVLFHEMGHALGLAHNFKGSLSMDTDNPASIFSTSIMDYNQFHTEKAAYESVDSANGPLLEYDRQMISVLYNNAKEIADAEVLPACDDDEADDESNGVDPLCLRYDAGLDPTRQLQATIDLVTNQNSSIHKMQSLAKALLSTQRLLGDAELIATLEDAEVKVNEVASAALATVSFYLGSGAQSIRSLALTNVRQLYVFQEGTLPDNYDAQAMRTRALEGFKFISQIEKLPISTSQAIEQLVVNVRAWLLSTPAAKSLNGSEQNDRIESILKPLSSLKARIEAPTSKGLLSRIRARSIGALVRVPTSPFYLDANQDFEAVAVELLEKQVSSKTETLSVRPIAERLAAATALKSFSDSPLGSSALTRTASLISQEVNIVKDARGREELRKLLKVLAN